MDNTVTDLIDGFAGKEPKIDKRIGLYFGSFNPIHTGHLIIASYMAQTDDIDEVWFVVSPQNPFKEKSSLLHEFDRYDLVQKAIEGNDQFDVTDIEFHMPKPSYTIDTVIRLTEKFPSYDLFAKATIEEVYEGGLDEAFKLEVSDFNSAVFINEGGVFKRINFPNEWQLFNWNDVVLNDINKDGNLDIVAAGNLYEAEVETPRCDAGNGLILFGKGDGTFDQKFPTSINWGNQNVKKINLIHTNNKSSIIIGNNNEQLELLKFEE